MQREQKGGSKQQKGKRKIERKGWRKERDGEKKKEKDI